MKIQINKLFLPSRVLKFLAPSLIAAGLLGLIVLPGLFPYKHQVVNTPTVTIKAAPTPVKPVPVAPTPPVAVPDPKPVPKIVASRPPAPVVVPSPASIVNSLTPEPPAPSAPSADPVSAVSYTSTNWSGYLTANGIYTRVSGSWVVPTVTGNGRTSSADATWVGIGGVSSSDLIQVGTSNIVAASGRVTTSAFYELLPNFAQTIISLVISPGDSISASVVETSAGQWVITITDNTTSQTFSQNVAYPSSHSSAEWIQEDPSYGNGKLIPLDIFGTVTFTNGMATSNGVSANILGNNSQLITLVSSAGIPLATTSPIKGGGASFSVTQN
ncbi:MAG: G1 family glutamic endopeptidase [Candidatus Saccharibacteria bacterium]